MRVDRPYWINTLNTSWAKRSVLWLSGVRRTGKTTLVKSLPNTDYFNCDDTDIQNHLKNPTQFFKNLSKETVVFDEIHQLDNASQILKIAADEFPNLKVLATGSSTLFANKKFKDTLTGRKKNIHFLPILVSELGAFGASLEKRLLFGGLPQSLLSKNLDWEYFSEWLDSFYARDIQELFNIEKRQAFLKIFEFLLIQNGQLIDITEISKVSGLSRPTVVKYLEALEKTNGITIVRPYSENPLKEIISQPKVYAFDTGFVCFSRKEKSLGSTEMGTLLENLVLETIQSIGITQGIYFWRDKQKHEIDFVIRLDNKQILAIECKSKAKNFNPKNLLKFRNLYKTGRNLVVTAENNPLQKQRIENIDVEFISIKNFLAIAKKLLIRHHMHS